MTFKENLNVKNRN